LRFPVSSQQPAAKERREEKAFTVDEGSLREKRRTNLVFTHSTKRKSWKQRKNSLQSETL
jgi:hypothetical protein